MNFIQRIRHGEGRLITDDRGRTWLSDEWFSVMRTYSLLDIWGNVRVRKSGSLIQINAAQNDVKLRQRLGAIKG